MPTLLSPRRLVAALAAFAVLLLGAGPADGVATFVARFPADDNLPGTDDGDLSSPTGVAGSTDGDFVFVVENTNHRVQKLEPDGDFVAKAGALDVGGNPVPGSGNGEFSFPYQAALAGGTLYVTDSFNARVQLLDAGDLSFLAAWTPVGDPSCPTGGFHPRGIDVAPDGRVYVTDFFSDHLFAFDGSGDCVMMLGTPGGGPGQFSGPHGVAVGTDGMVYVSDRNNQRVQVFDANGTYQFEFGELGTGPGQFGDPNNPVNTGPYGISTGPHGRVYVTDRWNHRVQQFTAAGRFLQVIGSNGSGDGQFSLPQHVDVAAGTIYVADTVNHRVQAFVDFQPDGLIGKPGNNVFIGDDVFNTTGSDQKKKAKANPNQKKKFKVRFVNDGTTGDTVSVGHDASGTPGFSVKYFESGIDVSSEVKTDTFTRALEPGEQLELKVKVRAKATSSPGSKKVVRVTGTSAQAPASDTVKAVVKRR